MYLWIRIEKNPLAQGSRDPQSTDLCKNYFFSLTKEDASEEISCLCLRKVNCYNPQGVLVCCVWERSVNDAYSEIPSCSEGEGMRISEVVSGRIRMNVTAPKNSKIDVWEIPELKIKARHRSPVPKDCCYALLKPGATQCMVQFVRHRWDLLYSFWFSCIYLLRNCFLLLSLSIYCFPPFPGFLLETIFFNFPCAMSVIEKAKQTQSGVKSRLKPCHIISAASPLLPKAVLSEAVFLSAL